ncbi:MAG: hypothetical protein SGBAC_007977 [Bacillariaceae sp.]
MSSTVKSKDSHEDVEAHLLDYISMTGMGNIEDIVNSFRNQEMIDLDIFKPKMAKLTRVSVQDRQLEMEENKEKYSASLKRFNNRVENLQSNKFYVRSLILQRYITGEMDAKIRNESYFDTTFKDLIQLLKRIEGFSKQSEDGNWYLCESLRKWTIMKQGPNEGNE